MHRNFPSFSSVYVRPRSSHVSKPTHYTQYKQIHNTMAPSLAIAFCCLVLLSLTYATVGAHPVPENSDKKLDKDFTQSDTVRIPGLGRYGVGSRGIPSFSGLDHSGPAAANGQYIPGFDDTFVPNPGFEVPNPYHKP